MTPVCPFVKASRPDDSPAKKTSENQSKHGQELELKAKKESCGGGDSVNSNSPKCPFGYDSVNADANASPKSAATIPAKCPLGYDSRSFKIGPLSCIICQALLFDTTKCVPCNHIFCKACVSPFRDCPLCGADIEKFEAEMNLQATVDRFIEGHARIKRSHINKHEEEEVGENTKVIYEDVSLERGAFLVQHAMRAFRAKNFESAKSRLSLCAEDIRGQIEAAGNTPELCSQLGAVLGMLGDCCRAMGDAGSAVAYFEESVEFLSKFPTDDQEVMHTLSVSLNKIGDLKYYDGDLEAAKSYYSRSLNVRRDAIEHHPHVSSQSLDVAVSLAKVADADRSLGNEDAAVSRFQEAIKLLESLTLKPEEAALDQRRLSVLEFLNNQLAEKQSDQSA
ncbi:protein NCA1 [Ricinus communis]|uniref:Ubiquitin-protein ligase, putative n=1 Tax=Ricinus communis TaxID=3988 RepID=B9SHW0_RICCO|nr:protein NCA1 [Ricinus communis]EEF36838.1 ubiquitin-protein ligase, putative [Ricinus communis]|eukprot:XP_002525579.1 protein NCA1 [Ricinus communis]